MLVHQRKVFEERERANQLQKQLEEFQANAGTQLKIEDIKTHFYLTNEELEELIDDYGSLNDEKIHNLIDFIVFIQNKQSDCEEKGSNTKVGEKKSEKRAIGGLHQGSVSTENGEKHEKVPVEDMNWNDLCKLGSKLGVYKVGMKRSAVERVVTEALE